MKGRSKLGEIISRFQVESVVVTMTFFHNQTLKPGCFQAGFELAHPPPYLAHGVCLLHAVVPELRHGVEVQAQKKKGSS